uniref:Cytochrome P450 monooxygenase CYP71D507 n=1 Tax=Thymus vulgaris TaxID=49992 RepID=A0A8K0YBP6_THYVU|nr:cytochrome P450 monooxygenase CYP71D507 [Thymus vulgaris]
MLTPWNLSATTALFLFPSVILFFFIIQKWNNAKECSSKLPPGPPKLPIIGNLHLLSSPPIRCFRDLSKRYGPIMYLKLGESSAVVVSSPEIAKEMLKDLDPIFADRPRGVAIEIMWYDYIDIVFCPYGDYWRQMRKICINELLSPRMVRSFRSIRRDEACRLAAAVRESSGRVSNLTEKIFSFSSSITCRAAFGGVCKDSPALIKLMMETLQMAGVFEVEDLFPSSRIVRALSRSKRRLVGMKKKLDVILDGVIEEHRENLAKITAAAAAEGRDSGERLGNGEFGGEDLVDVFVRIKEGGEMEFPIGNDNIKSVLYDIFSAGTETSSSTIDWVMVELLRNPKAMAKLQAELRQAETLEDDVVSKMKYLKLVIKETLRLHPPIPLVPRVSREAREINGYTLPAGTKVMVNIWAMQRDPMLWDDPEKFEPERFANRALEFTGGDFEYLPFGTGKRMCPGITFGMATVELGLAHLLYNFDWKLPEGSKVEDLDMIENDGITASRKDNLFVVATPYHPLA